jgi:hypothetical protein
MLKKKQSITSNNSNLTSLTQFYNNNLSINKSYKKLNLEPLFGIKIILDIERIIL